MGLKGNGRELQTEAKKRNHMWGNGRVFGGKKYKISGYCVLRGDVRQERRLFGIK